MYQNVSKCIKMYQNVSKCIKMYQSFFFHYITQEYKNLFYNLCVFNY